MAADAASFAPPDFKRQLAKHSRRLMQGVSDAAAGETGTRDAAAHRAAAARGARALAESIRRHTPFDEIAYQAGGIVHELALAFPPAGRAGRGHVRGRPLPRLFRRPFAAPETLAAAASAVRHAARVLRRVRHAHDAAPRLDLEDRRRRRLLRRAIPRLERTLRRP